MFNISHTYSFRIKGKSFGLLTTLHLMATGCRMNSTKPSVPPCLWATSCCWAAYPGSLTLVSYSPIYKKGLLAPPCHHFLCVIFALIYCNTSFSPVSFLEGRLKLPLISGYCSQAAEGNKLVCRVYLYFINCLGSQTFLDALTGNWKVVQ